MVIKGQPRTFASLLFALRLKTFLCLIAVAKIVIHMPKQKGRPTAKIVLGIVVIAVIAVAVIAWHDGLIGLTSINDINDGLVDIGTAVAVKGEVTVRLGNLITIADGSNFVIIVWAGASTLNSIVVVRGVVTTAFTLNATSMDVVWFFTQL
jgi:hypothetical protein